MLIAVAGERSLGRIRRFLEIQGCRVAGIKSDGLFNDIDLIAGTNNQHEGTTERGPFMGAQRDAAMDSLRTHLKSLFQSRDRKEAVQFRAIDRSLTVAALFVVTLVIHLHFDCMVQGYQ